MPSLSTDVPCVSDRPARRSALTDAAAELFAAQGYHATSVTDLTRAIGLGRGALYYHIKSKEDLLWDCLRIYADRLQTIGEALAEPGDPVPQRLRAFSRAFLATVLDLRPYIVISFREARSLSPDRVATLARRRRAFEDAIEGLLVEGARDGSLSVPHPRLATLGLLGAHVWTFDWFNPDGEMTIDRVSDGLMDGLLAGLSTIDREPLRPA